MELVHGSSRERPITIEVAHAHDQYDNGCIEFRALACMHVHVDRTCLHIHQTKNTLTMSSNGPTQRTQTLCEISLDISCSSMHALCAKQTICYAYLGTPSEHHSSGSFASSCVRQVFHSSVLGWSAHGSLMLPYLKLPTHNCQPLYNTRPKALDGPTGLWPCSSMKGLLI